MGDFNCTMGQHEKLGSRVWSHQRNQTELESLLTHTATHGLGYVGIPFTWSNNRSPPNYILERLDRCLGNDAWACGYRSLTVYHLTRLNSDHCPFLLTKGNMIRPRPPKFRFENMWTL